jgi:PBP1b-binding outer membrane lipoprotein LpoB
MNSMNPKSILVIAAAILAGCEARVTPVPAAVPVEKNTTTIVNPPAKEETKVEKKTTIVNPPAPSATEEEKTTTTIK